MVICFPAPLCWSLWVAASSGKATAPGRWPSPCTGLPEVWTSASCPQLLRPRGHNSSSLSLVEGNNLILVDFLIYWPHTYKSSFIQLSLNYLLFSARILTRRSTMEADAISQCEYLFFIHVLYFPLVLYEFISLKGFNVWI